MTGCWCILEPPQWTRNTLPATHNVLVNETAELRFHCSARGNPAPEIYWTKDGQSLDGSGISWYTVMRSVQPVDNHSTTVTSTLSWQGTCLIAVRYYNSNTYYMST